MKKIRWGYLIGLLLIFTLAFAVACGDDDEKKSEPLLGEELGTASMIHQWVSGGEPESFRALVAPWENLTGGTVSDQGTRDILAIVTTRVEGGNPPDIAVLAAPGTMQKFARDGELVALDSFLDMNEIRSEYSQAWIDLCTVDGKLYCIVWKASNKATVWYSPNQFAANGYSVPTTWDGMISLSDRIVADGKNPWSIGVESGGASGWPGTDWLGSIVLAESGGAVYDQWINHEIPWTDTAIKSAFERFGQIAHTQGYVPGGADFVLATNFVPGSYLPFESPPKAFMYHLGSFTSGFIKEQFPGLTVGEDYDFFAFPPISSQFAGAVTGGADLLVMFNDNKTNRRLMEYLASAAAQQIWVGRGGFTSTNNAVSLDNYEDPIDRKVAEQLVGAKLFRFDADDIWGGDLQATFWNGILDFLANPDDLDSILGEIETSAVEQLGPLQ